MCDSISERVAINCYTHAPPRFRSILQYRRVLSQSLAHTKGTKNRNIETLSGKMITCNHEVHIRDNKISVNLPRV